MGRPRKTDVKQEQPAAAQRLDALAVRIRDKLQGMVERNVERFLDNMDQILEGPQENIRAQAPRPKPLANPNTMRPAALTSGMNAVKGKRACSNCRQPGHKRNTCPNPKVEASDGDSDDEPESVPRTRVMTHKTVEWDEQLRLIKVVQDTGDKRAMDHLIRLNIGLVHRVAQKSAPWHSMDYEDIVQEGSMGLMKGILMFDTTRGLKLSTYATWWIRHYIVRANENNGIIRVPVHTQVSMMLVRKAQRKLAQELGREPTIDDVHAETKIPIKKLRLIFSHGRVSQSLDQVLSDEGEAALHDILADEGAADAELSIEAAEAAIQLHDALNSLPERDRAILRLRYLDGDGLTLKEIGEMIPNNQKGGVGISRERVRQMEADAIKLLKMRLKRGKLAIIDARAA